MIRLARIVLLALIWMALWSDISAANVLSGIAVAVVIVLLFDTWRSGNLVLRPLRAAWFGLYFLYQLVVSSLVVARTVVSPRAAVHTGIVAVPLQGCSEAVATLIADAITLTPGTLTLEVRREPLTLYVHALDIRDVDQVQADIAELEKYAVLAFGSDEAIAQIDVGGMRSWRGRR